jgi:hypothetical protein
MSEQETEFCWSCKQNKPKDQINADQGFFYFGICKSCIGELEDTLKENNVQLLTRNRKPHYSGWHSHDVVIRDIFVQRGNDEFFIRGFTTCDPAYETSEVFNLVKQFIESDFKSVKFYGNLDTLEKHDFWFYVQKVGQFYHFGGNCHDISNAFNFKTLDINQIWKYIEVWNKIPESLKTRIAKQLDKENIAFCSSTQYFGREKQFCFKDYSKDFRDPEIMILKNFVPVKA